MKKLQLIIRCLMITFTLIGCYSTINAVGDTPKRADRGSVNIIQGVGVGVNHIGHGVKADLTLDDSKDKKEK